MSRWWECFSVLLFLLLSMSSLVKNLLAIEDGKVCVVHIPLPSVSAFVYWVVYHLTSHLLTLLSSQYLMSHLQTSPRLTPSLISPLLSSPYLTQSLLCPGSPHLTSPLPTSPNFTPSQITPAHPPDSPTSRSRWSQTGLSALVYLLCGHASSPSPCVSGCQRLVGRGLGWRHMF